MIAQKTNEKTSRFKPIGYLILICIVFIILIFHFLLRFSCEWENISNTLWKTVPDTLISKHLEVCKNVVKHLVQYITSFILRCCHFRPLYFSLLFCSNIGIRKTGQDRCNRSKVEGSDTNQPVPLHPGECYICLSWWKEHSYSIQKL